MPTINLKRDFSTGAGVGSQWTPMLNGDTGQPFETLDFGDISVQVVGTFGVGGTVILEGCNQATPTTWATLNDPQGNAISFTAGKIEQILEMPRWIRPSVTGGDGTTSLSVELWARRSR
jgi:hypothetical protein